MGKKIDMTGWKMWEHGILDSKLTVLEEDINYKQSHNLKKGTYWKCQCQCGALKTFESHNLRNGKSKSCGCVRKSNYIDMTGWIMKEHNVPNSLLTILEEDFNYCQQNNIKNSKTYWKAQCECGNIITARGVSLRDGSILSCGCLHKKYTRALDLTNRKFGGLLCLKPTNKREGTAIIWECLCDCGKICYIPSTGLTKNLYTSCGCGSWRNKKVLNNIEDLTGQQFGELTVIKNLSITERTKNGHSYLCRCSCGNVIEVLARSLTAGQKSCGCIKSKGEYKIAQLLNDNQIIYETQKTFEDCLSPNGRKMIFDFYINNNFLLEFDGIQHFQNSPFFEQSLEQQQKYDIIKNKYCRDKHITLKRIPYWNLDQLTIEDILGNKYILED